MILKFKSRQVLVLKTEKVWSGEVISSMEQGLPLTLDIFQQTFGLIMHKPSSVIRKRSCHTQFKVTYCELAHVTMYRPKPAFLGKTVSRVVQCNTAESVTDLTFF